ncbi:hypothetical protein ISCGN_027776 [Ixodes scapularis]
MDEEREACARAAARGRTGSNGCLEPSEKFALGRDIKNAGVWRTVTRVNGFGASVLSPPRVSYSPRGCCPSRIAPGPIPPSVTRAALEGLLQRVRQRATEVFGEPVASRVELCRLVSRWSFTVLVEFLVAFGDMLYWSFRELRKHPCPALQNSYSIGVTSN